MSNGSARSNGTARAQPAKATRTEAIEEATNLHVIHPLARRLVQHFARWGLRPNTVSLMGMALGAGAAAAYFHYEQWPLVVLGFLLMVGWHVLDGADGQLARLTGQTSEIGRVLDGLCDHVTFALVYVSLALALTPSAGPWVWALAALAGLSHIVQASAYEYQRQAYDFWGHGKESALLTPRGLRADVQRKRGAARLFARLHLVYVRVQRRVAAVSDGLTDRLATALRQTEDEAAVRTTYRQHMARGVRHWGLLCSNYRTLALFVACLTAGPVYFFLFEIVILNAVFVALWMRQRRRNRALQERLPAPAPSPARP